MFQEYMREAQRRLSEFYSTNANSTSFPANKTPPVFEINAQLAKRFVAKNPGREFFTDDASIAEWMLPHLEPNGPILRLRSAPLETLGADGARRNRDYWTRRVNEWLGDWLGEKTPIEEICRFGETIYGRKDLSSFKGDASFVADARVRAEFARLRASIGRVYQWRAQHAASSLEQQRMRAEADFAFRQAIALSPSLQEALETYADFLKEVGRGDEAQTVLGLRTSVSRAP